MLQLKLQSLSRCLAGDNLEIIFQFQHLGSIFSSDCTLDAKIPHRVFLIKQCRTATETGQDLVLWGCDPARENALLSVYHLVSSALFRGETICSTKTHKPLGCLSDGLLAMHL